MTELWTDKPPIGAEEVARAEQILQKYKVGKAALDQRLVDNELWFRMGHWKNYQNPMMEGKPQPSSGWLFNSIANKHADAMDNYPAPNVLPRAPDDEQTARVLSSVLPVVLEQADYEQVYSDTWWRKLKQGTGVKGVFWDPEQRGGVGEITVRPMNLLMLYWEPGVDDIQASPNFFSLSLEDTDQLTERWPQLEGHSTSALEVPHYLHDGGLDTNGKSVVVDWYYKKRNAEGRRVLHYCKFCNGVVLYASENDPEYAGRGFYDHGQYPFVFDPLFVEEDSPAGFGYIDVMKECQTAIDRMNHAMDENVLLSSKQRYVLSDAAGVNEEELADFSRDIVHVVGRLGDDSFRPLQTTGLQGNSLSYRNSRIEELKEISGNRDMTQGGTAGGVTAASAIAALQEAGSKLSRDMLKSAYRAFAKECYLIIDLMRQFYDEERIFRIIGETGRSEFVHFSGAALRAQALPGVGGVELGSREPIFDIVVSAEKKSTFSRLSQNETAKECYQLGFFAPRNADAALAALEMMDFEGIEKVRQRVRQNGTLAQRLEQLQSQLVQLKQGPLSGPGENLSTAAAARAMKGAVS
uniref:portal protein n=1 Tax=Faecalibacterium prausnitzii TaxID=853 RepID=UPI0040290B98